MNLKACVVPSAPGRPSEGRLQTRHQVCMSHRATRVTKCVDEYRYVCVVIFYFLLFALKSHFPMLDPSSKSILWYKNLPSSDPLHQNKPAPLPSSPSKSAPMSCSGAGRQRPCPLKTLHHNPPSAPSLSTPWGGLLRFLGLLLLGCQLLHLRPISTDLLCLTGLCLAHLVEISF